jgi:ankyrin repeat protein
MIVLSNHNYKCAKYLIEHGANWIEEQVLSNAIKNEHKDLVEFLLEDAKNKKLSNYISLDDILESTKSVELFRMLVEESTDDKEKWKNLAFIKACKYNSLDVLKILIRKGVDVNYQNEKKETPLIIACSSGSKNVVKFLLEKGANVNKQGYGNDTPLLKAIHNGDFQVVKILIEHGADLKLENDLQITPLVESFNFPNILDLIAEKLIEVDRDYFFNRVANSNLPRLVSVRIVHILLDNDISINIGSRRRLNTVNDNEHDKKYQEVFWWSCVNGHKVMK